MPEFTPAQIDARIRSDREMQKLAQNDETEFLAQHAQIYEQFGYKPDGTPFSAAMRGVKGIAKATGLPEGLVQGVANVPIPLATTIAGSLAGSVAPGPGTLAGASIGSVAGEMINEKLGLRDELTGTDVAVAAAAPALGPLASRLKAGIPGLVQRFPGAGRAMHKLAADDLKTQIQHIEVDKGTVTFMRELMGQAKDFQTHVPLLKKAVAEESLAASNSKIPDLAYIKKLDQFSENLNATKTISFRDILETEKSLIELKTEAPNKAWAKFTGILVNDLEEQANNPTLHPNTRKKILNGVESFKNYLAVNKRFQGQEELAKLSNRAISEVEGDPNIIRFNKQVFHDMLKKNDTINSVYEKSEIDAMKKAVDDLGYLGVAPGKISVPSAVVHSGGAGAIGLGAYAVGGISGVIAVTLVAGTLRTAMASDAGRRAITYLAKKGKGHVDVLELKSMLGKMTAGASAGTVAGVSGVGSQSEGVQPFANQE